MAENIYIIAIYLISISLALLWGMRSNHIIGADVHLEYYLFQQTLINTKWQIIDATVLDSCLSISILPTIYQKILNVDQELLFKTLYPVLFSISPLIIYIISKKYMDNVYSFLTSLFFVSQLTFLSTAANPRTTIAILFFSLFIMVLLNNDLLSLPNGKFLLIIFILSCIFSHYSTSYIFFFFLLSNFILINIARKIIIYFYKYKTDGILIDTRHRIMDNPIQVSLLKSSNNLLTLGILMIFFVAIFIWYSQVTRVAFDNGLSFFINSIKSLNDLFISESRDETITTALGSGVGEYEIFRKINFIVSWSTIAFIAIGIFAVIIRHRQMVDLYYWNTHDPLNLLKKRLDLHFFIFSITCSFIMTTILALPFVANGYGVDRLFSQMAVVLSSLFTIGGMIISKAIHIRRGYLVILAILLPYFLCNTGALYQLFGYPGSILLNSKGDNFDAMYIFDQESLSAKWLANYDNNTVKIFGDYWATDRLISQGGIRKSSRAFPRDFLEKEKSLENAYIYLRYYNVVCGKLFLKNYPTLDIANYTYEFDKKGLIYSNGGSMVLL